MDAFFGLAFLARTSAKHGVGAMAVSHFTSPCLLRLPCTVSLFGRCQTDNANFRNDRRARPTPTLSGVPLSVGGGANNGADLWF